MSTSSLQAKKTVYTPLTQEIPTTSGGGKVDPGMFVGIKSLLEVTAVKLVLLVQKLLLLVMKVNVAGIKVTTTERLQLLKG
ncbi:hypothetical protein Tco_1469460 [Tanacetum coccineum]